MSDIYTVITGGLGGLGSAFADECARLGKNILLIDRHPDGKAMVSHLRKTHDVNIRYISCDLSNQVSRQSLISKIRDEHLLFNGLINVVGQEIEGPFLDRSLQELSYMLQLNISTLVDLTHSLLNLRAPDQRFLMVNIASLAGFFPMPNKSLYAASKQFIINLSLSLREELQEIANVTVVCPAGLPTNPESMKKIFLQGFWGKMTAQDTSIVVKRAMVKVQRNIPIYIPGFSNRLMIWLSKIIPVSWTVKYLSHRWKKAQPKLDLWRIVESQRKQS